MQLYLVHNDPLDTLLVSADGEPLYSVHTSATTPTSADSSPSPLSLSANLSLSPAFPLASDVTSASSASSGPPSPSSFKPVRPPLTRQFAGLPQNAHSQSQQKHRQPPANVHPTIPISRTHSNPHPHDHSQYPDPSSPQPSPALPPAHPSVHVHRPLSSPSAGPNSPPPHNPVTFIRRLERYNFSRGNVETEIGRIDYFTDVTNGDSKSAESGTRVLLCTTGVELFAPAGSSRTRKPASSPAPHTPGVESQSLSRRNDSATALDAFSDFCRESQRRQATALLPSPTPADEVGDSDDDEFIPDPTWPLNDPKDRPFKWISLASCPVLIHDTQPTPTPVARYRPAKLGITSRSRRGFLEILPAGVGLEDWIVVTFVAYFRMKLGEDACRNRGRAPQREYHGYGSGYGFQQALMVSAPATPYGGSTPQRLPASPQRPPPPPLPIAYLGALRRKGKDYGDLRPSW